MQFHTHDHSVYNLTGYVRTCTVFRRNRVTCANCIALECLIVIWEGVALYLLLLIEWHFLYILQWRGKMFFDGGAAFFEGLRA